MRDIDLLSDEYSVLQKCFDQIKNDPPSSVADFRKALQELAEAAQELKEMTAAMAARYDQTYGPAAPHLRLIKKDCGAYEDGRELRPRPAATSSDQ